MTVTHSEKRGPILGRTDELYVTEKYASSYIRRKLYFHSIREGNDEGVCITQSLFHFIDGVALAHTQ